MIKNILFYLPFKFIGRILIAKHKTHAYPNSIRNNKYSRSSSVLQQT